MNLVAYSLFPALILLLFGGMMATLLQMVSRPDGRVETVAVHSGRVALGLLIVWMIVLTTVQQQIPVINFGQLAAFLACLIWAGHSYVQTRIPQRLLAFFPVLAVVALVLLGFVTGLQSETTPRLIKGPWVSFHITLSLAGIAMILGAGVYGAGTLVLHRHLARRIFDRFFAGLPSLDDMNRLRKVALYAGWSLISVSLGSALIWMVTKQDPSIVVSHLHPMLTLWVIVSALVISERRKLFGQHRLAILSVGLASLVLILMVVSVIEIFAGVRL